MFQVRSLSLESLESRELLAVDILAQVDFAGDAPRFLPRNLTGYNDTLYLRMNDGHTGAEAWTSDGTAESTRLLKDIQVGNFGSGARDFTPFNGQLFFAANNGFSGLELWATSGTPATTQMVLDIWAGGENSAPTEFVVFQDHLYFFANDGVTGRELYRSDGTALGTEPVGDSVPGTKGASGESLTIIGDRMFFHSESVEPDFQGIWISDGTDAGTHKLPIEGVESLRIENLTPVGNQLVFSAGEQLWVTDGTEEGSKQITPAGDSLGTLFSGFASLNGKLFVTDELGLHEISSDFSTAHTISPLADGVTSSAGKLYYWNPAGFFVLSGAGSPERLIPFNQTFGTRMGTQHSVPGGMLFNINRALNRYEIWVTNGTAAGTQLLERVTDNSGEPFAEFLQVGDQVFFSATNGNFHESVWAIPAPVIEVVDPGPPGDVNGDELVNALDIDALYAAIANGSSDATLDLNDDSTVSEADVDFLLTEILKTRRGDINLDGKVDFSDFLTLSGAFGKTSATWGDGDFDGDGNVAFADFLALSSNFGFDAMAIDDK